MNFELYEGELEIFEKGEVPDDNTEPIVHMWQSKDNNVVISINKDCHIRETDDGYGNKLWVVEPAEGTK